ncbi:hypothetical protein ACROYT_G036705 [Oculina patagonica]
MDSRGRRGTHGTLNGRGDLFWGSRRRRIIEPIRDIPIIATIMMAHHFACKISCAPQMIIALIPAELRLLMHIAKSASKALLSEGLDASFIAGNNGVSSVETLCPGTGLGVFKLSSRFIDCLARPMVPGLYLRIKTHTATMV